jgi:hypothetical protein
MRCALSTETIASAEIATIADSRVSGRAYSDQDDSSPSFSASFT